MTHRAALVAAIASVLVLSACADEPAGPGADDAPRYATDAMVLENAEHGPMLCLGATAVPLAPNCGTVPVTGWDWGQVEGEESLSGTTWGTFHVLGTYDGSTFTLIEAGAERPPPTDPGDPIDTPCDEPAGGWVAPDPNRAADPDLQDARRAVEPEPDFSGLWIDYVDEPVDEGPVEPGSIILNVAFTGDLEQHEAVLREHWGGPLCLIRFERTFADLMRIQSELGGDAPADLGFEFLGSGIKPSENAVVLGVIVADEDLRIAVEERYGPGAVVLEPALIPMARRDRAR